MARVIRFYMREMRMEILIDVSVDVWCNCALVHVCVQCGYVDAMCTCTCRSGIHSTITRGSSSLVACVMCVYAYDRVLTSEFLLAALSHEPLEEVRKLFLRHVFL